MLDQSLVRRLLPLLATSVELAVLVAGGLMLGSWLDSRLHTGPWLALGLCMGGLGVGIARLVRKGMEADEEADGQSTDDDPG